MSSVDSVSSLLGELVKDFLTGNKTDAEAVFNELVTDLKAMMPSTGSYSGSGTYQLPPYSSSHPSGKGSNAASIAKQYLGWDEPTLQGDGVDQSAPYGESCADFVSSMLEKAGLINWHTNGVADLTSRLQAQGWTRVSLADAKPGDVWICYTNGEQHTEIVASNNNGQVTLIGSNNTSSNMQKISYDSYSASIAGSYILAPP